MLSTDQWLSILAFLLIHTGALLYWGGKASQLLKEHDRRIRDLEKVTERPVSWARMPIPASDESRVTS